MVNKPAKDEEEGGFWTGLLVGGLLGTVAGFFLGGDDKSELKRKLKDKAFDVWEGLSDYSQVVKDKAVDVKENLVEETVEIKQGVQEAVEKQVAGVKKKFFLQKGRSLHKKAK